jgi:hypothetical protein
MIEQDPVAVAEVPVSETLVESAPPFFVQRLAVRTRWAHQSPQPLIGSQPSFREAKPEILVDVACDNEACDAKDERHRYRCPASCDRHSLPSLHPADNSAEPDDPEFGPATSWTGPWRSESRPSSRKRTRMRPLIHSSALESMTLLSLRRQRQIRTSVDRRTLHTDHPVRRANGWRPERSGCRPYRRLRARLSRAQDVVGCVAVPGHSPADCPCDCILYIVAHVENSLFCRV